jgi:hypothetical protein
MAGLVPAIHVFVTLTKQDVDARDRRGHDESNNPRFGISAAFLDYLPSVWMSDSIRASKQLSERVACTWRVSLSSAFFQRAPTYRSGN